MPLAPKMQEKKAEKRHKKWTIRDCLGNGDLGTSCARYQFFGQMEVLKNARHMLFTEMRKECMIFGSLCGQKTQGAIAFFKFNNNNLPQCFVDGCAAGAQSGCQCDQL